MARLVIGAVTAMRSPDEAQVTPDDRQELVKTVAYAGGSFFPSVQVLDGGTSDDGAVTSYSGIKFHAGDWATIRGYWTGRLLVSVAGIDGELLTNCRIVLKQWKLDRKFNVVTADVDVWRV